jgi:hypothetical protein
LSFVKLFFVVFFVVHWVGCFFYLVGSEEYAEAPVTWLIYCGIEDLDNVLYLYCISLYFAMTTMATIGYGDIYPVTENEKIVVIIGMIASCGVFSFLLGSVHSIIDSSNSIISEFK